MNRTEAQHELRWFYVEAEHDLGLRGVMAAMDNAGRSSSAPTGLTAEAMKAVQKYRRVRRALDALEPRQRHLLELAYSPVSSERLAREAAPRKDGVATKVDREKPADVVFARLGAVGREAHRTLKLAVERAHDAYQAAREAQDSAVRAEVLAAVAMKQARRACLLAKTRAARLTPREERAMEVARWLEETGLLDAGDEDEAAA